MDHNLDLAQRYASQLSPEILLNIFRFTIPPDYCIDPVMKLGGRKNLWLNTMRTQKSVTLVSKSWNGPATEVLYEHIIFTRMGQIVAFAAHYVRKTGITPPLSRASCWIAALCSTPVSMSSRKISSSYSYAVRS